MRIGFIPYLFAVWFVIPVYAQHIDSLKMIELQEVIVSEAPRRTPTLNSALSVDLVEKEFLEKHFTGNLMQTLEHIPGVRAMDIGSGFSKPMIRGMAFNRITVTENGIKQEGQQWGADHGLEIDAFNAERIIVRKGPSSLLYGSDAMGGAIEIIPSPAPKENRVFGEVVLLGKSVNGNVGVSVMAGLKRNAWYSKFRFSEQHYGDYRIPTDTIVYLTQKLPVYGRKMKNTAGFERNVSLFTEYRKRYYSSSYTISNAYQKMGFFPGAHGIPDISRIQDDGNSRNIDLPHTTVNHFKFITHQQYVWEDVTAWWDLGFQNNRREEWSLFHTHYGSQQPPDKDSNKELDFNLNTYSAAFRVKWQPSNQWEHTFGWDAQFQKNTIDGYSFLLPEYRRFTTGVMWLAMYRVLPNLSVSGGGRFDYGKTTIDSFMDRNLENWLYRTGYQQEMVDAYRWRSYEVDRSFGDYSISVGMIWTPFRGHVIKVNGGRSFRLPAANELASNGMHHGTFRHEQGDPTLKSEQGWQVDLSYEYDKNGFTFSVSPFASWYSNYIYLKPTGEWSVLPHSGQIYTYTGAKAVFAGLEASLSVDFLTWFTYSFAGEYVYTYNRDENTALSFSPPPSMRNTLGWKNKYLRLSFELQSIADQNRVSRNEATTPGAHLLHADLGTNIPVWGSKVELLFSLRNITDKKYYNHLSFYRKLEIPEPGRNFQILVKVPF